MATKYQHEPVHPREKASSHSTNSRDLEKIIMEAHNTERLVRVETKVDVLSNSHEQARQENRDTRREHDLHSRQNEESFSQIKESIINLRNTATAQNLTLEALNKKQEHHDSQLRSLDSHIEIVEKQLEGRISHVEKLVRDEVGGVSKVLDDLKQTFEISKVRVIAWAAGAATVGTVVLALVKWLLENVIIK